ncbi:MAG: Cell surface protein [Labilithrix sp.]|nr:Cell surface protein [Labilithrix sp.]
MRSTSISVAAALSCTACAAAFVACSSEPARAGDGEAAPAVSLGDAAFVDAPDADGSKIVVDGGFEGPDGSVIRADRFVTKVVSATYGDCAGYGLTAMPGVVLGPPVGGGSLSGGLDVVSLGFKGEIVLGFEPNAIVDGPGVDFLVFENAFWAAGDPDHPAAELGDVSVSEDGVTWKTFPCTPGAGPTYGTCAGWHPVYSAPGNGISSIDPKEAGGDPYDLADLGVTTARFVRIRDLGTVDCPSNPGSKPTTVGFDLDAIAIVNARTP